MRNDISLLWKIRRFKLSTHVLQSLRLHRVEVTLKRSCEDPLRNQRARWKRQLRALIVSHGRAADCIVWCISVSWSLAALGYIAHLWEEVSRVFFLLRTPRLCHDTEWSRTRLATLSAHQRDVAMRETLKTRRPNTQGKKTKRARLVTLARLPACPRRTSNFRGMGLENNGSHGISLAKFFIRRFCINDKS